MYERHGATGTRLYQIWRGMINRCHQCTKGEKYDKYRARGIAVCAEWRTFPPFREWALSNGYEPDLTIERHDNDGDYTPQNCLWVTLKEQANNRRNSRFETIGGVRKTFTGWCEHHGIDVRAVQGRMRIGWSFERALTEPKRWSKKRATANG